MNSGDGHDKSDNSLGNDNVVYLKIPKEQKTPPPLPPTSHDKEPIINLPPYTKYFLALIIGVFLLTNYALSNEHLNWVFIHLGFIPARFTGGLAFEPLALVTPFTHMFIHGGWLHLAMNSIMLLAFGSGIEKWMGGKKMLILFLISGLFGVATHFALNYASIYPVVGASGGLSGLFAAALLMINKQQGGVQKIWPFVLLWIGISVLFGFMGSPDGGQIAWAAHVGGFLGGFVAMKLIKRF